jgi:hypothetical protein
MTLPVHRNRGILTTLSSVHRKALTGSTKILIIEFIISITKLLDADWLRGVQLFH